MPPRILTAEEARRLADRVLGFGTAEQQRVNIESEWRGDTRFAGSQITTAGATTDTSVSISSTFGRRRASTTTNVLDDASLRRAVELSERLARLSPEDPEFVAELGAQQYPTISAFVPATAELTPEARALAVQRVIGAAHTTSADRPADAIDPRTLDVSGYLEATAGSIAVATKSGLFGYHTSTGVSLSTTVRTADGSGSGYAASGARDWSMLDAGALGRRAAAKALASRNAQALEPGRYTVVLEPRAVADLLPYLAGAFVARTAEEGRGTFSKTGGQTRVGERIANPRVTIYSDPADALILGRPFDAEGLPVGRTVWIESGILRSLAYSRYWADRRGVAPTGGAGGGGGGGGGFGGAFGGPGGLSMLGGTKTTDELVADTERGILVTRFWYIRFLDPRTVMVTGLTRDGTFLIEKGRITRPVKNFRFNESPLFMLDKIADIGRAERVDTGVVVPALRVNDFTFTSLSDAV